MEKLYGGGTILTMEDACPVAEALVEQNGRIAAVGTRKALRAAYPAAESVDLAGGALLPAFLDAHSHFSSVASGLMQVSLAGCADFAAVEEKLRAFAHGSAKPGEWVLVRDYDPDLLAERRHLTAALLDRAAPENPVLVQHKCGHTGVASTAALRALGITDDTADPDGGRYGRDADGRLTGYLEENAFFANVRRVPAPGGEALLGAYRRAQEKYASYGITTVQEGMMVPQIAPLHRLLLASGALRLDLVSYPEFSAAPQLYRDFAAYAHGYCGHYRLGGIKIFLDGSPQERTAWMRPQSAYLPAAADGVRETARGTMSDAQVSAALAWAAQQRVQILAHCNGDAAAQQYLDAIAETERQYPDFAALRPVMIHAQLLAPDQLPRLRALGVLPSFFAAHVYHWGDAHIRNFGLARAALISPAADALREGLRFTFHQDAPVIEPDMLETVWCAVNRITRAGVPLGENERISVWEALRAVTLHAAYQYGEEAEKGSLAAGKAADFVWLSENPLAVPPEALREIRVLRTVKSGRTIFAHS